MFLGLLSNLQSIARRISLQQSSPAEGVAANFQLLMGPRLTTPDVKPHVTQLLRFRPLLKTARLLTRSVTRQHPDEFAAGERIEKKARWSTFEVGALERLETRLPNSTRNIYQELERLLFERHGLSRNTEMIKGQRRKPHYKEMVAMFRSTCPEILDIPNVASNSQHPASNSPSHPSSEHEGESVLRSALAHEERYMFESVLLELAEKALGGNNVLEDTASAIIDFLAPPERPVRMPERRISKKPETNRTRKQRRFKELRHLYNKNRHRLAEVLLDDAQPKRNEIPLPQCTEHFREIFESTSPCDDEPVRMKRGSHSTSSAGDITFKMELKEIEKALQGLPRNTSPGADNISAAMLRSVPVPALTILFNLWLFYLDVPAKFKESRTILLPKRNPVKGPMDYRPITISSVIYRLYSKILNQRLLQCTVLNKLQKAFRKGIDGCGENTFTLKTALALARSEHREICMASLDVAKAFDSVSHHSISRALIRQHASPETILLVSRLLSGSVTRIEHFEGVSEAIELRRGVKQGDPLSPLLFSLVIDELLDDLEDTKAGFTLGHDVLLCSLVFADDILLMSDSKAGLQSQLLSCSKFFKARSLHVNVSKCSTLRLYRVPKKRSVNVDLIPRFYLDPHEPDTLLPCFSASGFMKYLGVEFNPFGRRRDHIANVNCMVDKVCNAEMKPQHKVEIIRTYLLRRLLFTLTLGNPMANSARTIDKIIRQAIKEGQGGLGLLNLSETTDFCLLKLIKKLETSDDVVSQSCACTLSVLKLKTKLMQRLRISTLSNEELRAAKKRLMDARMVRFLATYQGSGFQEFSERRSNEWMSGEMMTGRSFICSIKARTNLVPTRLQTLRGRADLADQRVRCRRCGNISGAPESLAHISQTCMFTHGLITRRHDAVVDKIASIAIDAGYDSLREPILRCDGQTWKPDLVPYKGENSFIVDVAIPYESKEPLARRHHEKCRKYERLKATVCTLTKTKNCATGAIIIGARGAWCPRNDESLKLANINIKYRQKALLCLTVLERTNKIISWFMQVSEELQPRRTIAAGNINASQQSHSRRHQQPHVRPDL
uniref:Reverse transcriptase domain-containing protein n=1 Tax=Trichuris muris TaxID=70415 RepID=A0A5S6Q2M3_TRIMR